MRPLWQFLRTSRRGMRMVFLKQLPDASDGSRACYQAIIESDGKIFYDACRETTYTTPHGNVPKNKIGYVRVSIVLRQESHCT
jgi:hypothetical protein